MTSNDVAHGLLSINTNRDGRVMDLKNWSFWIAMAALVAGGGRFLDEYHIRLSYKERVRTALVRIFVALDDRKTLDLGRLSHRTFGRLSRSYLYIIIWTTSYFGIIVYSMILSNHGSFSADNHSSLEQYAVSILGESAPQHWVWAAIVLLMLANSLLSWGAMTLLFYKALTVTKLCRRRAIVILGFLVGLFGTFPVGFRLNDLVVEADRNLSFAGSMFIVPSIALATYVLIIYMAYALNFVVRFLSLHILDVASGPKTSPFTYASAIISLLILIATTIRAALY